MLAEVRSGEMDDKIPYAMLEMHFQIAPTRLQIVDLRRVVLKAPSRKGQDEMERGDALGRRLDRTEDAQNGRQRKTIYLRIAKKASF